MHRMKVDLPDPDGPQTTTVSCRPMTKSIPRSAWKSPNHLWTPSHSMMGSPVPPATRASAARSVVASLIASSLAYSQPALEAPTLPRHRVRHRPVSQRDEGEADGVQPLA